MNTSAVRRWKPRKTRIYLAYHRPPNKTRRARAIVPSTARGPREFVVYILYGHITFALARLQCRKTVIRFDVGVMMVHCHGNVNVWLVKRLLLSRLVEEEVVLVVRVVVVHWLVWKVTVVVFYIVLCVEVIWLRRLLWLLLHEVMLLLLLHWADHCHFH